MRMCAFVHVYVEEVGQSWIFFLPCILRRIISLNLELTDLARLSGSVSSRDLCPCLPYAGITDVCSRSGIYMGARNSSSRPHACASWSLPIVPSLLPLKLVFSYE